MEMIAHRLDTLEEENDSPSEKKEIERGEKSCSVREGRE